MTANEQSVINLVIAAREAWEEHGQSGDDLDRALEAFSASVPYENEPDAAALPASDEQSVEAVARAIAKGDGLDFDEVCGIDADPGVGECDSGTCIAAEYEDHDVDWAREIYLRRARAALAVLPAAHGEGEAVAWMYEASNGNLHLEKTRRQDWLGWGWAETPLYTHPAPDQSALVGELLPFTSHPVGCAVYGSWASGEPQCSCGLDDLRARARQGGAS